MLYLWGETNSGWLIWKMSGWLAASKGAENPTGVRLCKTMSVRLMTFTEGGNMLKGGKLWRLLWWEKGGQQKMEHWDWTGCCFTFQDVNTLFVGRVGGGVVWGREDPAVDVADPRAAVILVRALGAMFARGILKQECREQTIGWVIELEDQWWNDWSQGEWMERRERKGNSRHQIKREDRNWEKNLFVLWHTVRLLHYGWINNNRRREFEFQLTFSSLCQSESLFY